MTSHAESSHSGPSLYTTGRLRDTRSDYCTGQQYVDVGSLADGHALERRVDISLLLEPMQVTLDQLERHMDPDIPDTFSDELEMVEPSSIWRKFLQSLRNGGVLDPQSYWHLGWLVLVSVCFVYNSVVIPLRSTFPYQTPSNWHAWFACDLAADTVYAMDLVIVKPHVMFLSDGFLVRKKQITRRHYFSMWQFKMDIVSLMPLDLLYLKYGTENVLFRLPRLLKIQAFWDMYDHLDSVLMSPYLVRVARTLSYMMYLVHLNACAYYAFSAKEGIGSNSWVFGGQGNAYIRCFYFATKTATSVGKNPRPESEGEYLFMTMSWLMGVFVFALLIGQIRDIVATATRTKTEYRKRLDETLEHMRRLNLPERVQRRVQSWFTFTAQYQPFDEAKILNSLPHKLKLDVAINVHIGTLSKVNLFHRCDPALLRELVLKLRSVLYLPGDFICRKNEVGKEMYIVKTGQVEVLAPSSGEVLATLGEGSVFGEISLLALAGGNRRTADVRSRGFSNLFVLSKSDLNETLVYYPDAQEILKQKAEALMRENEARERREARMKRGSPPTSPDSSENGSDRYSRYRRNHGDKRRWSDSASPRPRIRLRTTSSDVGNAGRVRSPTTPTTSPPLKTSTEESPQVTSPEATPISPEQGTFTMTSARPSLQSDVLPDDVFRDDAVPSVHVTDHDSDLTEVTPTTITRRSSSTTTMTSSADLGSTRHRPRSSSDDNESKSSTSRSTASSISSSGSASTSSSATTRARQSTIRGSSTVSNDEADDTLSGLSSMSLSELKSSPVHLEPPLAETPRDTSRRLSAPTPHVKDWDDLSITSDVQDNSWMSSLVAPSSSSPTPGSSWNAVEDNLSEKDHSEGNLHPESQARRSSSRRSSDSSGGRMKVTNNSDRHKVLGHVTVHREKSQ